MHPKNNQTTKTRLRQTHLRRQIEIYTAFTPTAGFKTSKSPGPSQEFLVARRTRMVRSTNDPRNRPNIKIENQKWKFKLSLPKYRLEALNVTQQTINADTTDMGALGRPGLPRAPRVLSELPTSKFMKPLHYPHARRNIHPHKHCTKRNKNQQTTAGGPQNGLQLSSQSSRRRPCWANLKRITDYFVSCTFCLFWPPRRLKN